MPEGDEPAEMGGHFAARLPPEPNRAETLGAPQGPIVRLSPSTLSEGLRLGIVRACARLSEVFVGGSPSGFKRPCLPFPR